MYILEHRDPNSRSSYDAGTFNKGLAIWYVERRLRNHRDLIQFNWRGPGGPGQMAGAWTIGTTGESAGNYWTPTDGSAVLTRRDGGRPTIDTGLRIRVSQLRNDDAVVSWWDVRNGYIPRLDAITPIRGGFRLIGDFEPGRDDLTLLVRRRPGRRPVEIPIGISQADFIEVRTSHTFRPGEYQAWVEGRPTESSNHMKIRMR